jgi:DNA-binding beta-propeller fold protein YncE
MLVAVAAVAATLAVLVASAAQAAPFVYVTNEGSNDVSQYDIGPGGLLAPLSPATVAAGTAPQEGIAVSPDGRSVYVSAFAPGFAGGQVLQYDVGPGGGLSPKSPPSVPAGNWARLIAVSPDGRSAYVANWDSAGSVLQYDIGVGGTLSPKSPASVPAAGFTFGVAVSPDGRSVYATNFNLFDSSVSQYDVRDDGTLAPKTPATVATGNGPTGIAVSPDGASVYVANFQEGLVGRPGSLSQYDVGADGGLSPKSPATVVAGGRFPRIIGIGPDGGDLYVSDSGGGVLHFNVEAGGALSPQSSASAGDTPDGLAVSPDGSSVYVANVLSDNVSQFDVGSGGALSPKSPPTVAAGRFPGGVAVSEPRMPTTKDECKNGGWRDFGVFKNQGDCVSFVATGGKNPPG